MKYHRTVAVRLEEEFGVMLDRMAQEEDRPIGVMARILLKEAIMARKALIPPFIKWDIPPEPTKKEGKKG